MYAAGVLPQPHFRVPAATLVQGSNHPWLYDVTFSGFGVQLLLFLDLHKQCCLCPAYLDTAFKVLDYIKDTEIPIS